MNSTTSRLGGIIVAVLLTLALGACSAIKLGYNNLPDLAYWWLDGYVDFSDEQTPQVRLELERLHAWHRAEELPRFADMLGRMEQLVPGSISQQQACGFLAEIQGRLNLVADRAEPAVVALAATLGPRQLRHLERKQRRNVDKWREDWVDVPVAKQHDKRFDEMLERSEMIYGRLDGPQRAVLRQGLEKSIFDPQRILVDRQRRQQDLLQTLKRASEPGTSAADVRSLMRGYLDRAQHSPDPGYRAWQESLLQESCRIFSLVHESTTPAQRDQAVRRLRAYQRDLRELSAQR